MKTLIGLTIALGLLILVAIGLSVRNEAANEAHRQAAMAAGAADRAALAVTVTTAVASQDATLTRIEGDLHQIAPMQKQIKHLTNHPQTKTIIVQRPVIVAAPQKHAFLGIF